MENGGFAFFLKSTHFKSSNCKSHTVKLVIIDFGLLSVPFVWVTSSWTFIWIYTSLEAHQTTQAGLVTVSTESVWHTGCVWGLGLSCVGCWLTFETLTGMYWLRYLHTLEYNIRAEHSSLTSLPWFLRLCFVVTWDKIRHLIGQTDTKLTIYFFEFDIVNFDTRQAETFQHNNNMSLK